MGGSNQYLLFYGFVIALGMLQMLTGFFGIRAANDAAKVNPFRALCYGIALLFGSGGALGVGQWKDYYL